MATNRNNPLFNFRVEQELKDTFMKYCRVMGKDTAEVLIIFMQKFVIENKEKVEKLKAIQEECIANIKGRID